MANILINGDALLLFSNGMAIRLSEGTGDNLLNEDISNGYVDYIDWSGYRISMDSGEPEFIEKDGGMVMFKRYVSDLTDDEIVDALKYECRAEHNISYLAINL